MRRIIVPLATAALLAVVATGVVFALNYEGEDFCQDSPAWPNGTYLGQMHPYHSDFYRAYAERRGWDPCTKWANDQRNSAIRGLRELGLSVSDPIDPALSEARVLLRRALLRLEETFETPGRYAALTDGPFGSRVDIQWAHFDIEVFGSYHIGYHLIKVNEAYRHERAEALAVILAHEFVHASRPHRGIRTLDACLDEEQWAHEMEAWVWWALGPLLPQTDYERSILTPEEANTDWAKEWVRTVHHDSCHLHVAG